MTFGFIKLARENGVRWDEDVFAVVSYLCVECMNKHLYHIVDKNSY